MQSLGEICDAFQSDVETLSPADEDNAAHLRGLVTRLVRDAGERFEEHSIGEVPALMERSRQLLAALSAEAENPDDRQCRYQRQAAVLALLVLADAIARFHAGSRAHQRKTIEPLRDLVSAALSDLVEPAE